MDIKTALTYDDVLLVPQRSSIKSRQDVDVATKLSKNIDLKIPIIPAHMDTIAESRMAIALARLGSIGLIHRFCDIEHQVKEVKKVKRRQSVVIENPITILPEATLKEVKAKIAEYNFQSFLVSSDEQELLGILTSRDMMFSRNDQTLVKDLMTPKEKLITAPPGIDIDKAKEILITNKIEKLPIVDQAFKIKGLITATDIIKNYNNVSANRDAKGRLLTGAAIGVGPGAMERAKALVEADTDVLVLDIAHGHSQHALEIIKSIKNKYPSID